MLMVVLLLNVKIDDMELINGKAKEDFLNWLDQQDLAPYKVMFDEVPLNVKLPYIIEFLETKKYEGIPLFTKCFNFYHIFRIESQSIFDVWIQSIQKSNEIYNNQ